MQGPGHARAATTRRETALPAERRHIVMQEKNFSWRVQT